jgi:Flp pilus assembly protein TadG
MARCLVDVDEMRSQQHRNAGVTIVYTAVAMVALCAIISLALDYGRVQLVKTELQRAADAAARYGASGMRNVLNGTSAAAANAIAAAADNKADGTPVVLQSSDDELIIWNSTNKTATVTSDPLAANAVRVTARRTKAAGNAIPMSFASVVGFKSCDVTAVSIARFTTGEEESLTVKATGNPFLAGMPAGSAASVGNPHNNPDYAGTSSNPKQSPLESGISISPGAALSFDGVNGNAGNSSTSGNFTADGNTGDIQSNYTGNDNQIASMTGPLNSLVGVFLDDNKPTSGPTPANLDFSSAASRDFTTLKPQLKQIFFIGDGRTSNGDVQHFIPPAGATRLFLATWDGYEWNNNQGSFEVTVHGVGAVTLVK